MKNFLTVLCLCVISFNAFCAEPHYNCQLQSNSGNVTKTLKFQDGNLVCGHMGIDGCKDGTFVSIRLGVPDGKSSDIPIYGCHASGINMWIEQPVSSIRDCGTLELSEFLGEFGGNNVYYELGEGEALSDFCKINLADAEKNCIDTDGKWTDNKCECSGETVEKDGGLDVSPCKCVADLERGTDLNGKNPNKCWPKPYLANKCLKYRDGVEEDWLCPYYSGDYGDHDETNPKYNFHKYSKGSCDCDDWANNSRICINGDHAEYRDNCNCPGFSFDAVKAAYDRGSWDFGMDNEGFYCYKPYTQFNYQACSSDNDCKNIDNTKRPYLHSTSWKCIEQTAGVHVCAARECENGWEPKNGYCQESKTTQTPQSENKNAVSGGKAGTTKTCTDSNMDANCKCIVPGTVERGGVCVCTDFNKEIKGGKCEYTAAYRSKLKTDIDSKYSKIKSLTASFEVNKWKDAEGNFNTARLASDSIAGVVLGTAGGIITSKLVKKNQLKKGFEDIQCHIGGQSVADYGDEFTVGW